MIPHTQKVYPHKQEMSSQFNQLTQNCFHIIGIYPVGEDRPGARRRKVMKTGPCGSGLNPCFEAQHTTSSLHKGPPTKPRWIL